MIKKLVVHTFRNVRKDRLSLFLNIIGFAIGLSAALLLLVYVYTQFSYESGFRNRDRIYRVAVSLQLGEKTVDFAANVPAFAPALKKEIPEIENYTRIRNDFPQANFVYNNKLIRATNVYTVDSSFFSLFNFNFVYGSENALHEPNQIILTQSTATRIFGPEKNPLGEMLVLNKDLHVAVGAIIKDPPANTHLRFEGLLSWQSFAPDEVWNDAHAYTYVMVSKNVSDKQLRGKIKKFTEEDARVKEVESTLGGKVWTEPTLLSDIHTHSHRHNELSENITTGVLYIFISVILFFVVCISFNYINISISTSLTRTKEISMRKVFGAMKEQIRAQFLTESFLLILLAFLLSLCLMALMLQPFATLMETRIDLKIVLQFKFILLLIALLGVLTLLSAMYPAFYLSSFNPLETLRHMTMAKGGHKFIRKALIVLQLSISTVVISGIIIAVSQFDYISRVNAGFDKDNILILSVPNGKMVTLKQELQNEKFIQKVAGSDYYPSAQAPDEFMVEGRDGAMKTSSLRRLFMDSDFLRLMNIELVKGRGFDAAFSTDTNRAFIVNEAAVKMFGWNDPIGRKIKPVNFGSTGVIVGVIRNVHLYTLHQKIEPVIISFSSSQYTDGESLFIKLGSGDRHADIAKLAAIYHRVCGGELFQYEFLDDAYNNLYKSDKQLRDILLLGAFVLIVVTCLGLYGLSSLMAVKRSKEIGIRKVLGASSIGIALLHINDFYKLSLLGSLIAWPLAYYMCSRWLETFASHVNMNILVLILATLIIGVIVILTTAIHAYRLSVINPVKTIRE